MSSGLGSLDQILQRDGFIIYISGPKENGKTDFGLLLAEYCYLKKYRERISTNIETESYMIERQITDLPTLKLWLMEPKRKLFILDEAGLSIPKVRFMSTMNVEIMKILQMIRHYDSGFIGIAPSKRNVDSMFMNTDILDAHVRKTAKTIAKVHNYLTDRTCTLHDVPRTAINFNSKHIGEFLMQPKPNILEMPLCCQVANSYIQTMNMKQVGQAFNLEPEQVRRLLKEHLKHTMFTVHRLPDGISNHNEKVVTVERP